MSTFKNKNSLRTIEAQIVQKLKNNEALPKFTWFLYIKKKSVYCFNLVISIFLLCSSFFDKYHDFKSKVRIWDNSFNVVV